MFYFLSLHVCKFYHKILLYTPRSLFAARPGHVKENRIPQYVKINPKETMLHFTLWHKIETIDLNYRKSSFHPIETRSIFNSELFFLVMEIGKYKYEDMFKDTISYPSKGSNACRQIHLKSIKFADKYLKLIPKKIIHMLLKKIFFLIYDL